MTTGTHKPRLLILGVHKATEGYPNVLYRLLDLRESSDFDVTEINVPLWPENASKRWFSKPHKLLVSAFITHLILLLRFARAPAPDIIYIPYPAVFVLFLLAIWPRWARKGHVVADAFISIHDTVVNDRKLLNPRHLMARLLHWVEKHAYEQADRIVVDTPENAAHLCQTFDLPKSKVLAIPLSTNEGNYRPSAYCPHSHGFQVLFIGTLVPLHGIGTIIEAAALLRHRTDIEFRIIGDGQDAPIIDRLLTQLQPNLVWMRNWHTPKQLAQAIEESDICLGIFGDTEKAQRVCPLKVYAYASIGRPVITGDTEWLQNVARHLAAIPFATVRVSDPEALALKIVELVEDASMRSKLAMASQDFYETTLSNRVANEQLRKYLRMLTA